MNPMTTIRLNPVATTCSKRLMIAAAGIFLLFGNADGMEYQSRDSIRAAVDGFLQHRYQGDRDIEVEIGHIDNRLQLAKCATPLDVIRPEGARLLGHSTVTVKCSSRPGWKIYVPVRIRRFRQVLVARHALPRGSYLQPRDVMLMRRDVATLHSGYFTRFSEIQEMVTKRNLRQGHLLTPGVVKPPRLVRRGEAITILAKSGNLAIRVKGHALMDGRKGDVIRVRNDRSRREFQAQVVAPGVVKVNI